MTKIEIQKLAKGKKLVKAVVNGQVISGRITAVHATEYPGMGLLGSVSFKPARQNVYHFISVADLRLV